MIEQNGSDLWVTCARKLYKYNFSSNKIEEFSFEKTDNKHLIPELRMETIAGLRCLQDGNVVVALSGRGLAIYNPGIIKFSIVEADNTKTYTYHVTENSFENICIAQDRAKDIFIGSGKGLGIYSPEKHFFKMHKRDVFNGDLFPLTAASGFLQLENGNILVSYYYVNGGIVKTDSALHFKNQFLVVKNGNINNASIGIITRYYSHY